MATPEEAMQRHDSRAGELQRALHAYAMSSQAVRKLASRASEPMIAPNA